MRAGAIGGLAPALVVFRPCRFLVQIVSVYGMARRYDTICLLTDLGSTDETVGVLHAIVRDIAAHVGVIDLTHQIAPHDSRGAALALARAISYLPDGVIVASVQCDPERLIAVEVADGNGILVGPDTGVLASAVAMAGGAQRSVRLTNTNLHVQSPGLVVAVRDILVPVAAHLCNGVDLAELGTLVQAEALLPGTIPLPRWVEQDLLGEVMWVDRYGSCQLNIGPDDIQTLGHRIELEIGDVIRNAAVVGDVRQAAVGAVALLVDGNGMISIVAHDRSAADEMRTAVGDQVVLRAESQSSADDRSAAITTPVASPVAMRSR